MDSQLRPVTQRVRKPKCGGNARSMVPSRQVVVVQSDSQLVVPKINRTSDNRQPRSIAVYVPEETGAGSRAVSRQSPTCKIYVGCGVAETPMSRDRSNLLFLSRVHAKNVVDLVRRAYASLLVTSVAIRFGLLIL
jgi:hypothetical protein